MGTHGNVTWVLEDGVLLFRPENGENGTFGYIGDDVDSKPWLMFSREVKHVKFAPNVKAGESIHGMFMGMDMLETVDASNLDVTDVVDAGEMFSGLAKLHFVDLSGWALNEGTIVVGMFDGVNSEVRIRFDDWSMFLARKVLMESTMKSNKIIVLWEECS